MWRGILWRARGGGKCRRGRRYGPVNEAHSMRPISPHSLFHLLLYPRPHLRYLRYLRCLPGKPVWLIFDCKILLIN